MSRVAEPDRLVAGERRTSTHLAELVSALSLASDLGIGQPMEHALRTCLLAVQFGRALGVSQDELAEIYDVALLRRIGCVGDSHEASHLFGDELKARGEIAALDYTGKAEFAYYAARRIGADRPPLQRLRTLAAAVPSLPSGQERSAAAHCEVARGLAGVLGFRPDVIDALDQLYERWDGAGVPAGVPGRELRLSARIVPLVGDAEIFHRLGGLPAAQAMVERRSGGRYDPGVAREFLRRAGELFDVIHDRQSWEAVIAAEPIARRYLTESQLDAALTAMADFVDLKTPVFTGHSRGVAERASAAGEAGGLGAARVHLLWRAGLVHDLGRSGVANSIWEKGGALTESEWESVRLHAYLGERMLARVPDLLEVARVAGSHHERLDGSGYHRGVGAAQLSLEDRLLAAADVRQALSEPRPHRPALDDHQAAAELRHEVVSGRLDGEAVALVLAGEEARPRRRREWPAGLTAREVEVLALLSSGKTNKQIGRQLFVSPRTVGHHIQHIYRKLDVSTRAAATLFAMQHDLHRREDLSDDPR
jgi:HD-GYP domain-containing protein (c-di-GMP phosphodiesterase class II)